MTEQTSEDEVRQVFAEARRLLDYGRGADAGTALAAPAQGPAGRAAAAGGEEEVYVVFERANLAMGVHTLAERIAYLPVCHLQRRLATADQENQGAPTPRMLRAELSGAGRLGKCGVTWCCIHTAQ
jgi:hypothetical protein